MLFRSYDINEEIKNIKNSIASIDDASEISYDNTTSHLVATNVQSAIDEVNSYVKANTITAGDTHLIDTTDFISITMTADGYITIFTTTSGGTDSVLLALNTEGTNLIRLGTENGTYQFSTLFVRKGMTLYIKASATNIGGYFISTLS